MADLGNRRGRYALAPRGLMELEPWLRQEFDDYVQSCERCKKIVLAVSAI
jgi:hypothetical protein